MIFNPTLTTQYHQRRRSITAIRGLTDGRMDEIVSEKLIEATIHAIEMISPEERGSLGPNKLMLQCNHHEAAGMNYDRYDTIPGKYRKQQ